MFSIIIWLSIVMAISPLGCATVPPPMRSHEILHRERPFKKDAIKGTIGIIFPRSASEPQLHMPLPRGHAAMRGAAVGAKNVVGGGAVGGAFAIPPVYPIGALIGGIAGLFFSPIGVLVGGPIGALKAEPTAKVKKAEAELMKAIADEQLLSQFRNYFLRTMLEQTQYRFILITEESFTAPDKQANYRSLTSRGIDTVLEINALNIELVKELEPDKVFRSIELAINPYLIQVVNVHTKLIRTEDAAEIYVDSFTESSIKSYKFIEWGEDNARLFREELDGAYKSLSERIVNELFLPETQSGTQNGDSLL